jgi:hypothetical protein|uniref:Reverse transcriptase zinc-binding domain-containing protein n=1 Tax=Sipha flava TaxID=143950 RepID=A0A2S2Q3Z4_9HEMI
MGKIWKTQNYKLSEIKRTIHKWPLNYKIIKYEKIINRFRIGHIILTHGLLMAKEEPTSCQTCGTQLTVKHILTECRQCEILRSENNIPGQLHESLGPQLEATNNIINFLKQTDLYK